MKNFILIGAAGYIAPKHLDAIRKTGNRLIASMDVAENVGILDRFFPESAFFTDWLRFERFCTQHKEEIDYVAVCSPTHRHDSHCRFGLRIGADVICEKPLVLTPHNLAELQQAEKETGQRINIVFQLRYHPVFEQIKQHLDQSVIEHHKIDIIYTAPRGSWYSRTWKGSKEKSGGIVANIGSHVLDMMFQIFGENYYTTKEAVAPEEVVGKIRFKRADVEFLFSTRADVAGERVIEVDGTQFEIQNEPGLHVRCYEEILRGGGVGTDEVEMLTRFMSNF